jgi:hypothetical protein
MISIRVGFGSFGGQSDIKLVASSNRAFHLMLALGIVINNGPTIKGIKRKICSERREMDVK